MPIRQLAPDVAAKIAAGEVVERPASVVKELIENSIDAGATQIRVDLVNGGLQLIRVTDNGSGIPASELPLALERHATSKVAQIDDLEHIRSLGFRGEALASIAAVADVILLSRSRDATQGAQISAADGKLSAATTAASPVGTTLTVRNLFSSVPARLKFIKSRNTEVSHCHHLLEQYALAYPEIRFSVFSENRQIFSTPGDGQLSSVLVEVYGLQIAEQMVPISMTEPVGDAGYPIVSGYVSRPSCYKSTRQYISFFVNRRWVLSRLLSSAVEGAYNTLLLTGRHPIAVVNLQIDPAFLDVNVHPAKTEIRFLKERRVFATLLRAVRQALLEEPTVPQWQVHRRADEQEIGEESLEESAIAHIFSNEAETIQASQEQLTTSALDTTTFSSADTPSSTSNDEEETAVFPPDNPWLTVTEEETGSRPSLLSRLWQSHVQSSDPPERPSHDTVGKHTISTHGEHGTMHPAGSAGSYQNASTTQPTPLSQEQITAPPLTQTPEESAYKDKPVAPSLGKSIDPHQTRRLPDLRVLGQLAQSYIVAEGKDGMYLIDQHAAHERILLERMVAALKARETISQLLLTPIKLELAPNELEALEEHQSQLEQIGFGVEIADGKLVNIGAVPGVLVKQVNAGSLHELLIELTASESLGHTENWEERALANVACKAAIKANYFLTLSEMREMIEQLEQTRAPYSCCHGRPTMIHFSLPALAREFERR